VSVVSFIALFVIAGAATEQPCRQTWDHYVYNTATQRYELVQTTASGNYGCSLGTSLHGVEVLSNGGWMANTAGNGEFQCVEYVKRYYRTCDVGLKLNLDQSIDRARNYYAGYDNPTYSYLRESGLACFAKGGTVMPEIGDILVYDDPNRNTGHVAIITSVGVSDYSTSNFSTTVETIEQNWSLNGRYTLSLTVANGRYTVAPQNDRRNYPVLGWLGLRKQHWDFQNHSPLPQPTSIPVQCMRVGLANSNSLTFMCFRCKLKTEESL